FPPANKFGDRESGSAFPINIASWLAVGRLTQVISRRACARRSSETLSAKDCGKLSTIDLQSISRASIVPHVVQGILTQTRSGSWSRLAIHCARLFIRPPHLLSWDRHRSSRRLQHRSWSLHLDREG